MATNIEKKIEALEFEYGQLEIAKGFCKNEPDMQAIRNREKEIHKLLDNMKEKE